MLVGKKIGPFVVDKELGSGAMGTVYRAKHGPSGKFVAIKMVSPAIGSNPQSMRRFEREGNILKQLKHPNIVRLIAIGKFQTMPFYAMEYVEGESLDHVMDRRGRLTWEELIPMGQQLCAALQHAHLAGIVHRDLKPANVMMLRDGTLKLTDFGIAKDLDVTALTAANSTVGTAAYMSPEQCRGSKEVTSKSDLYSMGIMFYELITGRKPFVAESAMEMFLQHSEGQFERPSRIILEIPVWLDTLITQLMEKDPQKRPFDAETVARALEQIQEKVEAQQSAGLDRVTARRTERTGDAPELDEKDREAARTLLRKKKRTKFVPIHERTWFRGLFLGMALVAIVILFYYIFIKKPSADALFSRAEALMASEDYDQRQEARKGPIADFLHYYPDDPRAKKLRDYAELAHSELLENSMHRRRNNPLIKKPHEGAETLAWQALTHEDDGNLVEARALWVQLAGYKKKMYKDEKPWGLVGERYVSQIDEAVHYYNQLKATDKTGKVEFKEKADQLAWKAITNEDSPQQSIDSKKVFWQDLKKYAAADDAKRKWYLIATMRLRDLTLQPVKTPPKKKNFEPSEK